MRFSLTTKIALVIIAVLIAGFGASTALTIQRESDLLVVTNVAARLAGFASGGQIVVGPATADRIRRHFVLEDLGEKTFKNVSEPIRVYRLVPAGIYEKVV